MSRTCMAEVLNVGFHSSCTCAICGMRKHGNLSETSLEEASNIYAYMSFLVTAK